MKAKEFTELLASLRACEDATEWAKGKSLAVVWKTCERGDWMLWLAGRMVGKEGWPTREKVVLAACACAELALKYVPAGEERPKNAIETARKWARGEATLQEVNAADAADAADAAYAASSAAYAAYAASSAADAASSADAAYADASAAYADASADAASAASDAYADASAAYAAYADASADAASAASDAAYAAASDADAAYAARKKTLGQCADIARKMLKVPA